MPGGKYDVTKFIHREEVNRDEEQFAVVQSYGGVDLKVMSYNILADSFIKVQATYCEPECLTPENRFAKVIDEIAYYDPDLICLQEVEFSFLTLWGKKLLDIGYQYCSNISRSTDGPGNAIYYRTSLLRPIFQPVYSFDNIDEVHVKQNLAPFFEEFNAQNIPSGKSRRKAYAWRRKFAELNSPLQIQAFEIYNTVSPITTVVVNAHMYWDPRHSDYKVMQMFHANLALASALISWFPEIKDTISLMVPMSEYKPKIETKNEKRHSDFVSSAEIATLSACIQRSRAAPTHTISTINDRPFHKVASSLPPLIFACDSNTLPTLDGTDTNPPKYPIGGCSGLHALMMEGHLPPDHPEHPAEKRKYLISTIKHLVLPWRWQSSYLSVLGQNLPWTNWQPRFCGTLDYIYCGGKCVPLSVLDFTRKDRTKFAPYRGIPNIWAASDHIPILTTVRCLYEYPSSEEASLLDM